MTKMLRVKQMLYLQEEGPLESSEKSKDRVLEREEGWENEGTAVSRNKVSGQEWKLFLHSQPLKGHLRKSHQNREKLLYFFWLQMVNCAEDWGQSRGQAGTSVTSQGLGRISVGAALPVSSKAGFGSIFCTLVGLLHCFCTSYLPPQLIACSVMCPSAPNSFSQSSISPILSHVGWQSISVLLCVRADFVTL